MVRKVESDPESVSGTGSPQKVNKFFRLTGRIMQTQVSMKSAYSVIVHTHSDSVTFLIIAPYKYSYLLTYLLTYL